jgi:uncharacterized protein
MKKAFGIFFLLSTCYFLVTCAFSKADYQNEEVSFNSNGTMLAGSIVFPEKGPIHAVAVFVHGSGRMTRDMELAKKFAAEGIAAFVYDKRGVGRSGGNFSEGYCSENCLQVLADDAVAAVNFLSGHQRLKNIPIGLTGFSQGGWIVPLAAAKSPLIKFIGLWSGPVCKLSEEDIYSQYTSDRDFKSVPGFEQVVKIRKQAYVWDEKFGKNIDPVESLKLLDIPGFWIFGLNDGSIPVDLSISRLKQLKNEERKNYDYVAFSGIGHSLINQTFSTMAMWIKNSVNNPKIPAKNTALNSEYFDKFCGTYSSTNPPIQITIVRKNKQLLAVSKTDTIQLEQSDNNSFFYNDYGSGFAFLDFDIQREILMATQQGNMYTLKKVNNK